MEIVPQLLLVLLLVFLNGFFVASEFALVAIRKTRIEELARKKNIRARLVQRALTDLESYISATQLGITVASLALGWIGEPALAHFFQGQFGFLPETGAVITSHAISIAISFLIITFLHIVLGELVPKTVGLQKAEATALYIIARLTAFTKIFRPFIWFLNGSGAIVLKLFGFTPPSGHQLVHSEEEIKMILAQSHEEGALEKREVEMVYNVFQLGDIPVRQIMVPRTEIIGLKVATTLKEALLTLQRYTHSRYPVYEHSLDTIVGFVHVKDLYKVALKLPESTKLSNTNSIRGIISVPEIKRADDVLIDMRKKRVHLAVVHDEWGGTLGIVTLEDIIESLVGEIQDEFDNPTHQIIKQEDGSFIID